MKYFFAVSEITGNKRAVSVHDKNGTQDLNLPKWQVNQMSGEQQNRTAGIARAAAVGAVLGSVVGTVLPARPKKNKKRAAVGRTLRTVGEAMQDLASMIER